MDKYYQVTCNEAVGTFKEGTSYKEIAEFFQEYYPYEIIGAKVNEDFVDLSNVLQKDCTISFFTVADEYGNKVYSRSARFILVLAVKKVFGSKARVIIQHSQDKGVYFTIEGVRIKDDSLKLIVDAFKKIVESDYLFTRLTVSRLEAMSYFHKKKMYDKELLLKYISNTYINLYRIDTIYDYFYGRMAYSTKQINVFEISRLDEGFVLHLPSIFSPQKIIDYKYNNKVYTKFNDAINFGNNINLKNVSDLNYKVSMGDIKDIILMSEAYYNDQLLNLADDIISRKSKLILMAGPSSSGKTTTSKKLCIYLKSKGYNTIAISIDDYFTDIDKRVKNEDGTYDYESIRAVDISLFNKQINKLLNGEEVYLSQFDFVKGKQSFKEKSVKLNKSDIIVVEGLHALNDKLTEIIDKKYKYKVYITPLTSLNLDSHNHIHTSDTRKLRRIVRDSKNRGVDAKTTLSMWHDIQKGEIENIFPFQNNVDSVINSSLMYELGVLKTYVEPLLYSVESGDKEYPEAIRLINFLRNFLPIPSDDIPNDSVLREFIGGSCFK